MQDVVRKRVVGAGVLVILAVIVIVGLNQYRHGSSLDGAQTMRVYEIDTAGEIELVQPAASDQTDDTGETLVASMFDDAAGDMPTQSSQAATVTTQADGEAAHAAADAVESESQDSTAQQATQAPGESSQTTAAPTETQTASATTATSSGASTDSTPLQHDVDSGAWIVQVASFMKKQNSRAVAQQLNTDFPAYYTRAEIDGDTWYRVRVGPLESEAQADNIAAELRAAGHNTLVLQVD